MKCPKCHSENKEGSISCKKCGHDFSKSPNLWKPSWKWYIKTLGIIYAILIVVFFALNIILKPYMRQIPKDLTPWLKDTKNQKNG